MIALRSDVAALDPRALLLTGRAILLWPGDAAQPSAVVLVPRGASTVQLCGAPLDARLQVANGGYEAMWQHGRVLVTRT